jgi:hypothetical protein
METCEIVFTSPGELGILKEFIDIKDLSSDESNEIKKFLAGFIKKHNQRVSQYAE